MTTEVKTLDEYRARAATVERPLGDYETVEREDGTYELELVRYEQPYDPHQLREVDGNRITQEFLYEHVPVTFLSPDSDEFIIAYN